MLTRRHLRTRTRCVLVSVASTLGAAVLVRWLGRALVVGIDGGIDGGVDGGAGVLAPTVEESLVRLCLGALLGATAWAWLAALSVVLEAWRGQPGRHPVPAPLRRLVLVCCGVALAAPVAPASATVPGEEHPAPPPAIAGLPLPDRPAGPARAHPTAQPRLQPAAPRTVLVRPGDCLWRLAAADLPTDASPAQVSAHWRVIHRLNAAVIGPDPDLIHPGQRLVLPARPATR